MLPTATVERLAPPEVFSEEWDLDLLVAGLREVHVAGLSPAQPPCRLGDRVEDGLQLERGPSDDLQDLVRRGLVLEVLALEGLGEVALVVDLREPIDDGEPVDLLVVLRLDVFAREELDGHNAHSLVDAGDPNAVVPDRADYARAVRSVLVIVERKVVVVHEVPAHDVARDIVTEYVHPVHSLVRIAPDIEREIFVGIVHARVDHGYDNALRALLLGPGLVGADFRDAPGAAHIRVSGSSRLRRKARRSCNANVSVMV